MKFYVIILAIIFMSISSRAYATSFTFSATYDGTSTTLDAGSDPMIGTNLSVGDDFTYTLQADENDFWTVDTTQNYFLANFAVYPSATRIGNVTTEYRNNGILQLSNSVVGQQTQNVHVGINSEQLPAGLTFDSLNVDYALTASTDTNSVFQAIVFFLGSPGDLTGITYTNNPPDPIPEPATVALLGLGLAGLAGVEVRRRRKKKAVDKS